MSDSLKLTILKKVIICFNFIRCFPHMVYFQIHRNKFLIKADTRTWLHKLGLDYALTVGFIYLLSFHREFRNLFYARIGFTKYLLNLFCPKLPTLLLGTKEIGEGLFIQYGISTAIGAKSIGKNCTISQQVTIGATIKEQKPVLLDNVFVCPGAIIIGNITVGNNTIIGANATVYRNIPDNCKVSAAESRILRLKSSQDCGNNENTTDKSASKG